MTEHIFETLETDAGLGVVVDGTMAITGVTAQREEVVRCRDCANFEQDDVLPGCTLLDFASDRMLERGYCAWGVPKGEDK